MQPEAFTLTRLDQAPSTDDDQGVISFDSTLQIGSEGGQFFVGLQTFDFPPGCVIWFQNTDGDIPIGIPPTRVVQPNFVVGVQVPLPANYSCTIRSYLQLNGQQLPPGANLSLVVYQIVQPGTATLNQ